MEPLLDKLARHMHSGVKPVIIRVSSLLMVPVCIVGLFYQKSYIWVVCPQALIVMFIRQAQHAFDSLGAAGYPDLLTAVLYYPVVGWILSRANRKGTLQRVSLHIGFWHIAAILTAFAAGEIRNRIWGFR